MTLKVDSGMEGSAHPPVALSKWCADGGFTLITAWRWRRRGWLKTVNICGRQYLTAAAIAEFNRRAEAGEFAKSCVVPRREALV